MSTENKTDSNYDPKRKFDIIVKLIFIILNY